MSAEVFAGSSKELLVGCAKEAEVVLTNPPFFESQADKQALEKPGFEARDEEVVYEGGEIAFVLKLLEESLEYQKSCASPQTVTRAFFIYVGKKSSITTLEAEVLRLSTQSGISIFTFSETLYQGNTARWMWGWHFSKMAN